MQVLKAFVIGMGVLLLAGFVVVVFTVIQRAGDGLGPDPEPWSMAAADPAIKPPAPTGVSPAEAPPAEAPPAEASALLARAPIPAIAVPPGAVLREIVPAGRHLVLHFGLPNGGDMLRILDLRAGGETLDVEIKEAP